MRVDCRPLVIPFAVAFRHAAAERRETASIWVEAHDDDLTGWGEGCPRPYVTGETVDSALAFVASCRDDVSRSVGDVASLVQWMAAHADAIDANPAAWCAVELAVLDLLARRAGTTVDGLLQLAPLAPQFQYTAVLGVADEPAFSALLGAYGHMGLTDFKLKVSGDAARDRRNVGLLAARPGCRVRVDANNLWTSAEDALAALAGLPATLTGVEEPVRPGDLPTLVQVADGLGVPVILDESVTRVAQVDALPGPATRWIVNVRVSKMGGLLRSLDVVRVARARGVRVVVGAQVGETSLLTRAALTVATAAGEALIAQEGAFGTRLLARDVCEPPLMFGKGGILRWSDHPGASGLGFGIVPLLLETSARP